MAMAFPVAVVDTKYLEEIEKACRYLPPLIAFKNCAPITLRLAWHDAGTYGVNTKTSGARNTKEMKGKHPRITYADLYQLARVVVVEVTGGPTIDFVPGRKNSNICPKEG